MANKFKKGDEVILISGSEKGKVGTIRSINGQKIIVDGVNLSTIHKKSNSDSLGKITKIEKYLHVSNISHFKSQKPVKIKFFIEKIDKKTFKSKYRVLKKTGEKIIWQ